jgi:hypothetical protein
MHAKNVSDRGKFRQLAAQIAMLFLTRQAKGDSAFCDINARAIDDFYYEHLGFDGESPEAKRMIDILERITYLLRDQKRPKIIGHEAIHLVLLVDSLLDDYTRSWESTLAAGFDEFRANLAKAKQTKDDANPSEYWLRYGIGTRVNSDRAETIQRRHEFFAGKMRDILKPVPKDPQRTFGRLERELIYYRDRKRCAVCDAEVAWSEVEIHHVEQHAKGGRTEMANGALVHKHCHPKGPATEIFARKWAVLRDQPLEQRKSPVNEPIDDSDED